MGSVSSYRIHDNGGRPYRVDIKGNINGTSLAQVYSLDLGALDTSDLRYHPDPILTINAREVFIGADPKKVTFLGNTILLRIQAHEGGCPDSQAHRGDTGPTYTYVQIGNRGILTFTTSAKIVSYVSPVGNSNVPYPYAVDDAGYAYLMLDNVKVRAPDNIDPYDWYYGASGICEVSDPHSRSILNNFAGITSFHIGAKQYNMRYDPAPGDDYDRLISWGKGVPAVVINRERVDLTRDDYIALMESCGHFAGFTPFATEVICEREETTCTVAVLGA